MFGGEAPTPSIVVAGKPSDTVPYVVVYEQADDGGWGASLPDLPGVFALGATRDEVTTRIQEAVALYAEMMGERGEPIPHPASSAGVVHL